MPGGGYRPGVFNPGGLYGGGYLPSAFNPGYRLAYQNQPKIDPTHMDAARGQAPLGQRGLSGKINSFGGFGDGYSRPTFNANEGLGWGFLAGAIPAIIGGAPIAAALVGAGASGAMGGLTNNALNYGISKLPEQYREGASYIPQIYNAYSTLTGNAPSEQKAYSTIQQAIPWLSRLFGGGGGGGQQPPTPEQMQQMQLRQQQLQEIAARNNMVMDRADYHQMMRDFMFQGSGGWGGKPNWLGGHGGLGNIDIGSTTQRMGFGF